jgi:RNA polymerase sigma-70 factor (ECF subfamily)
MSTLPHDPPALVEHFFRHESGRLVALLSRALGLHHLELVEDVVQGALLKALQSWSRQGIPTEPEAWLYRTARNLAIDEIRRRGVHDRILPDVYPGQIEADEPAHPSLTADFDDAPLRLLFVCCHESVPEPSRVALALKVLCGFSTAEIARALLTTEANIQKRISRARDRLRELDVSLDSPSLVEASLRLESVLSVIYLIFNEGYQASHADLTVRRDLCEEALRLGRMLASHPAGQAPQLSALLALICYQSARFEARVTPDGGVLLLNEQDRTRWDWRLVREGMFWMSRSASGSEVSRFHVEAAIAWEHCRAPSFEETDWPSIVALYRTLGQIAPSFIHKLNLAVAVSYVDGPKAAIALLETADAGDLPARYPLWHAVLGELRFRDGDIKRAEADFTRALAATYARSDQELLRKRLADCRQRLPGRVRVEPPGPPR